MLNTSAHITTLTTYLYNPSFVPFGLNLFFLLSFGNQESLNCKYCSEADVHFSSNDWWRSDIFYSAYFASQISTNYCSNVVNVDVVYNRLSARSLSRHVSWCVDLVYPSDLHVTCLACLHLLRTYLFSCWMFYVYCSYPQKAKWNFLILCNFIVLEATSAMRMHV